MSTLVGKPFPRGRKQPPQPLAHIRLRRKPLPSGPQHLRAGLGNLFAAADEGGGDSGEVNELVDLDRQIGTQSTQLVFGRGNGQEKVQRVVE